MCNLQNILPTLVQPDNLPSALPLIHVSKSGKSGFQQIINNLCLSPHHCEVFQECLLYFSYGNVFYDTGNRATRDLTKLPICFLFSPEILAKINYYYPYDTGAAYSSKYGKHSQHLRNNFTRYRVDGNGNNNNIKPPIQLVYYIYKTNKNYRDGQIETNHESELCKSLPELFEFFEDQNIEGCDERQYTIECQTIQQINLNNYLKWIAFPETFNDLFSQLFKLMQPSPPYRYSYHPGTIYHPQKIIGEIRAKAQEYIEHIYLEIG